MRSFRRSRLALLSLLAALVGLGVFYGAAYGKHAPPSQRDTKPPDVHLHFAGDKGVYNAAGWASGCASAGFCGTAADPVTGVTAVSLSIQQVSTGKYWTGTGFFSTSQVFVPTAGTAGWSYAFPLGKFPADDDYAVQVKAVDGVGHVSDAAAKAASASFTIDTTPPPAPTFKKIDTQPAHGANAHFHYTDAEKGAGFQCQLDGSGYLDCPPSVAYHGIAPGSHTLCVKAVDKAGNTSAPTCYSWNVGAGLPYTMGGSAIGPLQPGGPPQPVDVTFDNPNSDTVLVTTLTVEITGVTGDCSISDFEVGQDYSGAPFEIPIGTSDLGSIGIDQAQWPTIRMLDNGNQDGCVGATVALSFTGSP